MYSHVVSYGRKNRAKATVREQKRGAADTAPVKEAIMARKPLGMHVEDIKSSLRKKWGSLSALSKHLGKNQNAVTQTIATPGYSVPLEQAIADELGREPRDIWPDRYHLDGSPISFRAERTPTVLTCAAHRQNEVAA